jgi:guanylate kinase
VPELRKKLEKYDTVFAPVDITGAEYLKSAYGALTIFIMPESFAEYRTRIRARSPEMSLREFDMRMKVSREEIHAHSPRYDYRVVNAGGLLEETIEHVVEIMKKEGYSL